MHTAIINIFPGYEYKDGMNLYRGVDLGKGGYNYAEPGMYKNVAVLDIASQHPHSILAMNCFGEYTPRFKELLDARIAIKHKDFEAARKLMGGKLAPYLTDESQSKALANALKIAINSVYGLTAAGFDNPFRDIRNKNNIVALRGALFMKTLQDELQSRGCTIAQIKTDGIKIHDAAPETIQFVMDFAKGYGYTFEHEATYDRMCLVNKSTFIARYPDGKWTAVDDQFATPYVFKTLFSKEPIVFKDMCEAKSVTTALYLDMNEDLADTEHDYHFVGKVGQFCPIKQGYGGGLLLRETTNKTTGEKGYSAVTGSKGYRWLESEMVEALRKEDSIDRSYYNRMVDEAVKAISKYGDFERFVSDDPLPDTVPDPNYECPPWLMPCGDKRYGTCHECPKYHDDPDNPQCTLGYKLSHIFIDKLEK